MNKIKEIIVEPTKILVGSTFLVKIKTINSFNYQELSEKSYLEIKKITYSEIKGE